MERNIVQPITDAIGSEKLESTILSRRQAVAGLGFFGLFLAAPSLVRSDKAEAKALDAAAEAAVRQESDADARAQDKIDEVEVAEAGENGTATDFSSQYYWRRRYRRRYFIVRRRYWRRRYWRRRRWW